MTGCSDTIFIYISSYEIVEAYRIFSYDDGCSRPLCIRCPSTASLAGAADIMAGWEKLDLLKVLFDIGFPIVQYQEMD